MNRKFLYSVLLCVMAITAQAQCNLTSLSGSQVISTNTSWAAGTYNIAGDFTVNAGVTLTITGNGGCPFTVNANNINILGTIVADGAGNTGGAGGAGGTSSGGPGGGSLAGGGGGGSVGNGTGGGTGGSNGAAATSGCAIDCGSIICTGGNDADRAGGGGGAGGSGGSYGSTGGAGGAGAQGRLENEPGNSDCGSTPVPGSGGSGNAAAAGYGNAADNTDLNVGSGGGGGGGGGGGFDAGTVGSTGGAGGGAVNLDATGNLTVSGTITANGLTGGVGGNGGDRSGTAGNWNCTACSNGDGGGANACRDASLCSECTYYTWAWPGGAGGGSGGGSGGGIKLQAQGVFNLTGTLEANGGNGGNAGRPWSSLDGSCNNYASGGGSGSGGVIKYVYNPCENNIFNPASVSANAGNAGSGTDGNPSTNTGNAGVIFNQSSQLVFAGYGTLTTPLASSSQTICAGVTPATLNTIITGGTGPFTYQWYSSNSTPDGQVGSNPFPAPGWNIVSGATQDTLSSSVIGPLNTTMYYQVLVSVGNCIQWSEVATITVTPSPKIDSISVTNILCAGNGNASINITASGGTNPYNYSIDSGSTFQADSSFGNLAGGTYDVVVTDANNCSASYASNPVTVTSPLPVTQTDITTPSLCLGISTGSIIVNGSGGTGTLHYSVNGGAYQVSDTFNGLASGVYYVNVKDANGCTSGAQPVTVGNTDTLLASVSGQSNVSCNGGSNGSVTVQVSGGTGPYSYSIDSGTAQSTPTFSGLSAGTYYIGFSDNRGCTANITAQVSQPAVLKLVVDSVINVSCGIPNSGGAITHGTGGTAPYSFLWSNSATTADVSGLAQNTYGVILTDSNGCADTATVSVGYDSSLILHALVTAPRCLGDDESVSLTVSNGTSPFIYNWSNGDTGANVNNLTLGSTTVSVTDANNCSASQTFITTQPQALVISVDSVEPLCSSATGSASAGVSGGSTPYIYSWSTGANSDTVNNLAPGAYTVTAFDANNCTATASFSLSNQSGFSVSTSATADSCFGGSDGTAQATINGGVGVFTYLWNNGDTASAINNVAAGNYIVTVTDNSNGCTISSAVSVSQPSPIHPVISTTGAAPGQSNGSAMVDSVKGGTAPFSIQWSTGQSGPNATGLAVGSYTLTVTDKNGCSQVDTIVISQTSGISQVNGNIQMQVYPNPAKNELSVDLGMVNNLTTLSIRNLLGQQVIYKSVTAEHNVIDISGLASGVYMLEVRQGENASVQEIIVNK